MFGGIDRQSTLESKNVPSSRGGSCLPLTCRTLRHSWSPTPVTPADLRRVGPSVVPVEIPVWEDLRNDLRTPTTEVSAPFRLLSGTEERRPSSPGRSLPSPLTSSRCLQGCTTPKDSGSEECHGAQTGSLEAGWTGKSRCTSSPRVQMSLPSGSARPRYLSPGGQTKAKDHSLRGPTRGGLPWRDDSRPLGLCDTQL